MKSHVPPTLVALLATSCIAADFLAVEPAERPNHLVPVCSYVTGYEALLRQELLVVPGGCGQMVVQPSFSPEYAVCVDREGVGAAERFYVTLTEAESSLYFSLPVNQGGGSKSKQRAKVRIIRHDAEVPRALAIAVQRAWASVLRHTRYPKGYTGGCDGEASQYSVFVRGLGILEGETWSPDHGLPAEIRAAGGHLADYCKAPASERHKMVAGLVAELERLEAEAIRAEPVAPPEPPPRVAAGNSTVRKGGSP